MRELLNIVYDENHSNICKLDMHLPDEPSPCPVFIFFHGGGLEGGCKEEPQELKNITLEGIALVSVEYRMYPEAKFPEFIEDAAKAIYFIKKYNEANNSFNEFYVGGSSAGGYLALMNYFDHRYLSKYGIDPNYIKGWIFDAGQPTAHFNVLRERGLDTRLIRVDETAPIYFIDKDMVSDKQSRLMFIVAENDIPNRLEQTKLMLKTMEQFNYDMSKIHFNLMMGCTHCSYSINNIVSDFILGGCSTK
ncbi:alpha/beta hydrolase [Clostridium thermarum]|uniref:alpha/beta hydrolase n=1 Tax=Clostridium thermarum TaxID=1716543 RepID=UPI00112463BB|nr:alpha/beta hydrolase [Clostridium thermarum]